MFFLCCYTYVFRVLLISPNIAILNMSMIAAENVNGFKRTEETKNTLPNQSTTIPYNYQTNKQTARTHKTITTNLTNNLLF